MLVCLLVPHRRHFLDLQYVIAKLSLLSIFVETKYFPRKLVTAVLYSNACRAFFLHATHGGPIGFRENE